MAFEYSPFILPLLAATLISSWVALFCWVRRDAPTAFSLMLLALAIVVWSVGYIFEITGVDLHTKTIWGKFQYPGIALTPFLWLVLTLNYAGMSKWLAARNIALLLVLPLTTIVLVLTNERHGLIWPETFVSRTGNFSSLGVTHGLWFWIHSGYSYILLAVGTLILIRSLPHIKTAYRRQTASLLLGALVPWVGNAIYIFGLSPIPYLDLTPFFLTISVSAFTWGIYGFHLLDLAPVAQDIVIEEMKDGMIVLDTRNRIVDINPAALKMIDATEAQVIGKTIPRVIGNLPHLLDRYLDKQEVADEITIGAGAAQRWYELRISPLHNRKGRSLGRVITVHDITARKQTEILLQESEARYRQIVENAGDIIYRTDAWGKFTYVNPTALRIMGFNDEREVLGRHFLELASPDHRSALRRFYDKQFISLRPNTYYEFPAVTVSGREVWLGQNVQIIKDGNTITGFQAVARDITDRKLSENAIAYARDQAIEANRLKSQLLAKVSHELRIPLSAVLGFAELLRDHVYGPLPDRQRSVVEEIIDSTNYLAKIIEDLLYEAQAEAKVLKLHRESVPLKEFIHSIENHMSVLAQNKKLRLLCSGADDLPETITTDRQKLQQIMVNLIGNAIKFTHTGEVRMHASRSGPDHWRFDIADTGIGIPAEALERIFEPFLQVEGSSGEESQGTGLGLAITRQLVELMNGNIHVTSTVNVGSTFTVTLPVSV